MLRKFEELAVSSGVVYRLTCCKTREFIKIPHMTVRRPDGSFCNQNAMDINTLETFLLLSQDECECVGKLTCVH